MKLSQLCLLVFPVLTACATVENTSSDAKGFEEKEYVTGSRIPSQGQKSTKTLSPDAIEELRTQVQMAKPVPQAGGGK
ncbi:hypothetical protein [Undibacterium sp. Ren11W]|uniref:hypothetical protein n=1 Tax=Undibacterium sp. Ren11W TaxID=3413045 RepID=UPI003BF4105F